MLKHIRTGLMALCALLAVLILVDFSFFEETYVEQVLAKNRSLEEYYNAAGNSHYSFWIQPKHFTFPVSEPFASLVQKGQMLKLSVSPVFGEVNACEIIPSGNKETYSLRLLSGLLLPLLVLVVLGLSFKYKEKMSTLVFVMELALIANVFFLLR